jgi:Glycosyl transferase family 2.
MCQSITISLCMIVKNEELTLDRCLTSIKDAVDEIIIVDTGSTDLTKNIGKKYTDKIFDFKWIDDFSAARNFSFSKATMDYILMA